MEAKIIMKALGVAQMRTRTCPCCPLCGQKGVFLYDGLRDHMFGSIGEWKLKRCPNTACGLVWLDPMPFEADLWKAYSHYYTHIAQDTADSAGVCRRVYGVAKRAYLANSYGYSLGSARALYKWLGKVLFCFPTRRSDVDFEIRFLHAVDGGRLLDVGCGSGEWIAKMQNLGWKVQGVDFDQHAVEAARRTGLSVLSGTLEEQKLPSELFDAITLNHVIEHVPSPQGLLQECWRILKPGGKLIVVTPNVQSLGHRMFRKTWRGLEPPRHLHLFTMHAMQRTLERVGFQRAAIRPRIAMSVIQESVLLWRDWTGDRATPFRNKTAAAIARVCNFVESCIVVLKPSAAECFAAVAIKKK